MRNPKTKTLMLQDCHEILRTDGPRDINHLVRILRSDEETAKACYVRCRLSSSTLAGVLRAYGKSLTPPVRCFRQKGGPRIWYVEGDNRINKFVERSRRVRKSAYQPLIDAMHDMLRWYDFDEDDF